MVSPKDVATAVTGAAATRSNMPRCRIHSMALASVCARSPLVCPGFLGTMESTLAKIPVGSYLSLSSFLIHFHKANVSLDSLAAPPPTFFSLSSGIDW